MDRVPITRSIFVYSAFFAEAERANYEVAVFYSEIPVISSFLIPTQETTKGDCKNGMDQLDLVEFNSRRRFSEHTQQFSENSFEESDDDKSPLLEKYLAQLSTSLDFSFAGDRYGWVEEIEKPELIKGIKALSKEDIELITLYVFDDLTQNEIGVRFGISQKAVSKRIEQIRKHLNKCSYFF